MPFILNFWLQLRPLVAVFHRCSSEKVPENLQGNSWCHFVGKVVGLLGLNSNIR